jgi:hypothetical protein
METHHTHHHDHPQHKEKLWKHYALEFIMLFLAVFCGFLAENFRESRIENEREKVYMENLYQDLKDDTANFSNYNKITSDFLLSIDTMMMLMKSPGRDAHLGKIYFNARMATVRPNYFFPNERTFGEMKSSGSLRLIRNQQVADSIAGYYNSLTRVLFQNEVIREKLGDYQLVAGNIFDAQILFQILKDGKPPSSDSLKLLSYDPMVINGVLARLQYFYGSRLLQQRWCAERAQKAQRLLQLIQKEYHFQ